MMTQRPGKMRHLKWLYARPIAHRGLHHASAGIIENTSSAVEAAIINGYAIEVDVQLTGDGEAVVFHDYTLDRLTRSSGSLRDKSTTEILNARFRHCDDRIQTLSELLEQVAGRQTLVIEIKANWGMPGPLEARISDALSGYDGPVAVMSFDPQSIAFFQDNAPHLTRGITIEKFNQGQGWRETFSFPRRISLRHMAEFKDARPQFVAVNVDDLPCAPSRLFKQMGLPVLSWTVRTDKDRSRATQFADQIIFEGFIP